MIELFSPAKINLFLRIPRGRPDGYYSLKTINLGDSLSSTPATFLISGTKH